MIGDLEYINEYSSSFTHKHTVAAELTLTFSSECAIGDPFTSKMHVESSRRGTGNGGKRQSKTTSSAPGHYNDYHALPWLKPHQGFCFHRQAQPGWVALLSKLFEGPHALDPDPMTRQDALHLHQVDKLQAKNWSFIASDRLTSAKRWMQGMWRVGLMWRGLVIRGPIKHKRTEEEMATQSVPMLLFQRFVLAEMNMSIRDRALNATHDLVFIWCISILDNRIDVNCLQY